MAGIVVVAKADHPDTRALDPSRTVCARGRAGDNRAGVRGRVVARGDGAERPARLGVARGGVGRGGRLRGVETAGSRAGTRSAGPERPCSAIGPRARGQRWCEAAALALRAARPPGVPESSSAPGVGAGAPTALAAPKAGAHCTHLGAEPKASKTSIAPNRPCSQGVPWVGPTWRVAGGTSWSRSHGRPFRLHSRSVWSFRRATFLRFAFASSLQRRSCASASTITCIPTSTPGSAAKRGTLL